MSTEIKIYKDYSICAECKGKCCVYMPGCYSPEDFDNNITEELIRSLLDSGKVSIDWWEGNPSNPDDWSISGYYLRPRIQGAKIVHPSFGGKCINWTFEKGCELPEEKRPYQCRMLIPNKDQRNCDTLPEDKATKQDIAVKWLPYNNLFKKIIKDYEE